METNPENMPQTILPRWRGFNLMEMYTWRHDGNFHEDDFRWMSEWGFNFVRLPTSYRLWAPNDDVYQIDEGMLENLDQAIRWGQQYGLHVSLNFHRAPGYCINPGQTEPFDLWKDKEALDAFCYHWAMFAKRYQGISTEDLSFDLVNEPPAYSEKMSEEDYERVVRTTVGAIREVDSGRLIFCEGHSVGNEPCFNLADLGIAQSCRGYIPGTITHYQASWVRNAYTGEPEWPEAREDGWNRARLQQHYDKWADLASRGVGVHCGEMGVFRYTPHDIALRWFEDVLEILKSMNIGYSLWNFRTDFGILDTERSDVDYEDWYGHKLDRKLLQLLQRY